MAPKPRQSRQQMLQLRQLDLQLAFTGPGPLSENIQNQRRAIQNLAIEDLLQIAALRRRKFVVENDRIDIRPAAMQRKLVRLAFANERPGAGRGHFLQAIADHLASSGGG